MSVEELGGAIEVCHIMVMNDKEMEILKLIGQAALAMSNNEEMPPDPTPEQQQTFLDFCLRVQEM